jgi:pimeloyl-ACP methyl ester carboxylesterase
MASSMIDVDATVLDPVLAGTSDAFLDPTVPLGVPALLVAADPAKPDAVASTEAVQHYAAISDDVEVIVMNGAGHLIHDERAGRDRFRTAVLTFLERVAPA